MKTVLPIVLMVLLAFFAVGIPLAALPQHVRSTLLLADIWVGIVLGLQSVVTLLTRHYAGTIADTRGAKHAVQYGIALTVLSGFITLLSLKVQSYAALTIILFGRVVLGAGESLLITGALTWGIGFAGPANAGRVMAWSGMAMYAAIAASAPLVHWCARNFSFAGVLVTTIILPASAGGIAFFMPATATSGGRRMPFYAVLHRVWKPGLGLALSAVSFVGLAGFSALLFEERGWQYASLVMTFFGAAYITARLLFAHAPDQYGGRKIALISLAIAGIGQACVFSAASPAWALVGAVLTGFGYSLTFPSFGVEAVKSVDPQYKGVALGAYVAFFDLALAVISPLAGFIAGTMGYAMVYALGFASCAAAFLVALQIRSHRNIT